MKRTIFTLSVLLLSSTVELFADEIKRTDRKIGVGITDDRGLKLMYPISPSYNLNFDFAYSKKIDSDNSTDYDIYGLTLGSRKFIAVDKFSRTFFDFDMSINFIDFENKSETEVAYEAFFGFEILFHEKFGIEGKAGIGIQNNSMTSSKYFNYPLTSISLNYYID